MSNSALSGMRLKEQLKEKNIKHKDFANMTNITPTSLSRYISGKYFIPDKYLIKAASLLGISPEYLTGEVDIPNGSLNKTTIEVEPETNFLINKTMEYLKERGYSFSVYLDSHEHILPLDVTGCELHSTEESFIDKYILPLVNDDKYIDDLSGGNLLFQIRKHSYSTTNTYNDFVKKIKNLASDDILIRNALSMVEESTNSFSKYDEFKYSFLTNPNYFRKKSEVEMTEYRKKLHALKLLKKKSYLSCDNICLLLGQQKEIYMSIFNINCIFMGIKIPTQEVYDAIESVMQSFLMKIQ